MPNSAAPKQIVKKITPTKVTGGGGFEFEDKVAAFFMCCLLSDTPPLDPSYGTIKKIDFQVKIDGWFLDDLLLTLTDGGMQRRCAFSIKSNVQFSKTSAPSDFVKDAWKQFLGDESTIFNKGTDRIGIITTPLDTETKTKLEGLLGKARAQDPIQLSRRIDREGYISIEAKKIFESFSCPQELADKHSIDKSTIAELLRCVDHLDFDFEHTSSRRISDAISILRGILESSSLNEAKNLWNKLCTIARETRTQGGCIDLGSLVGKLRKIYRLKNFPDHVPIWKMIKQKTRDEIGLIPDKIANSVFIDRKNKVEEIIQKLDKHSIVVLLGESGCGKTVIEKTIADSKIETHKVVWINTETLSIMNDLPSRDILEVIPDGMAFLIIDGLDRFYSDSQFKQVALLLKSCCLNIANSPWKIIMSCQPEEWARVQSSLSKLNVRTDFELITLKNPTDEDLAPVWQEFPLLKNLSLQIHLRQFLFKPKVLDLFASKMQTDGAFDSKALNDTINNCSRVGESHLISWYWEQEIRNGTDGLRKSVVLKHIAEKLADEFVTNIPSADFSSDELSVIGDLVNRRILVSRNDKISFEHDLIADWARLRILLGKCPNIYEYINNKLVSPLWCKSLRLLGIHFLETSSDINAWKELFDSFAKEKNEGNLGQDLLLEASIFSSNPLSNLEKLWQEMQKDGGLLLCRFLNRFLYSASFPNKIALFIASQYEGEAMSELVARNRDPYWLYWMPVVKFLHTHKEDVHKLAPKHVAEIVDKWLRFSKNDWPVRTEAAEIAIETAEDRLAINMSDIGAHGMSDLVRYAYRAGIAACNEQSERSFDFALTACSRKKPSGEILELITKYNEEDRRRKSKVKEPKRKIPKEFFTPIFDDGPIPPPWPDGPIVQVERDFHELCLDPETDLDILCPLINSNPKIAHEAILALLIEPPTPKDRYGSRLREYTGMAYTHNWFPPFHTRGPFYYFLNTHTERGLSLIISLVNFATERWADQWTNDDREAPSIEIEFSAKKRRFVGDAYVYYWHRDVGQVSHIISSALMALEKWIYDRLEKEETKESAIKVIEEILKTGHSLSFIGLLISIGKKRTELFTNHLLPLLSVPEFYSWDMEHIIKSEGHQMIGWFGKGSFIVKSAQEWNGMKHRKTSISVLAPRLFILMEQTRDSFEKYRKKWIKRFEDGDLESVSYDVMVNLIHWFDMSNWKTKEYPEQGEIHAFEMPEEITKKRQAGLKEMQDRGALIHLPINFRRILDGQEKVSPDSTEKIWDSIQYVLNIEAKEEDPDKDVLQKDNAICGGIAILFKYFRDWLKQKPDKETWCINKISELILNPHPEKSFDSGVGFGNWLWDRYCAETMPIIWAEDPKNRLYRRCMAVLAINKHYETVGILFRAASEFRGSLKENFKQLENFLIGLAHAKWKDSRGQYCEKKSFDMNKWIEKEVALFEKGKTPSGIVKWEDITWKEMQKRNKLIKEEVKNPVLPHGALKT